MINQISEGKILNYTAGGTILSGAPVVFGNRVGIAMQKMVSGEIGAILIEGVVEINKVSAQAWAVGDVIFWDAAASLFTTVGTANTIAGYASETAANPSSTGRLSLSPNYKQMPVQAASVAATVADAVIDLNLLIGKLKAAGLMANS